VRAALPALSEGDISDIVGSEAPVLKGILFDVDGVLLDSEPFIREAAVAMFAESGIKASEADFIPFTSTGEDRFLAGPAAIYGVPYRPAMKDRTYRIYGEIVRGRLTGLPGSTAFMALCRSRGLKLALATSADRVKLEINLREIGLPEDAFDALISAGDVERKKPFPDIYLKAAAAIGPGAEDCLVVEDAISGILAGRSAGARCLGITTSFPAAELTRAGAEWTAADLSSVPASALEW
jgi:beta-phosphoglucomutase